MIKYDKKKDLKLGKQAKIIFGHSLLNPVDENDARNLARKLFTAAVNERDSLFLVSVHLLKRAKREHLQRNMTWKVVSMIHIPSSFWPCSVWIKAAPLKIENIGQLIHFMHHRLPLKHFMINSDPFSFFSSGPCVLLCETPRNVQKSLVINLQGMWAQHRGRKAQMPTSKSTFIHLEVTAALPCRSSGTTIA